MIEHTVKLTAQPGTFQPSSFTEWIGHYVDVTSLDPSHQHILRAVENSEDGTYSLLTLHTVRDQGPDLAAAMSVRVGTPTVFVVAHCDGQPIASTHMEAPLQPGQPVRVGNQTYTVRDVCYPNRRDDGTTEGDDYQLANIVATDAPEHAVSSLGAAGALGALLGGAM